MRPYSVFGSPANCALDFRIWGIATSLFSWTQAVIFHPITPPNLDLTELGQVALTGDFDAISLYTYQGQNENGFSVNGSQSLISQLPNGNYESSATADAYIKAMCPFVMQDGTFAGVIVGGNFTSLGGIEAQGVALFNPNTSEVTPLPGLSGQVSAIYCDQDTNTVYVGGDFKGANSTNAIAWVGMSGWANLPFAGFNGPVSSIAKATNGNIIFGGAFTGLGNTTTPMRKDQQVINLSSANVTAGSSSSQPGFDDPSNVVCGTQGRDEAGSTWLVKDRSPGFWQADFDFGFEPSMLRIWNTHQDGRGTRTFRYTAFPLKGIMNFTFTDPDTGKEALCDALCPLSSNQSVEFQDFHFVNTVGMNSFRIEISDWYGKGAGLNGIALFQNDTFAYAVSDLNEPSCTNIKFASNSSRTGPWTVTPSGASNSLYLTVNLTQPDVKPEAASVVFRPDIKQSGNYSIKIYTPGCLQDNTCDARGIVNVTGIYTSQTQPRPPAPSFIYQTNDYDKYDEIYYGPVDANSDVFRPTITLTPSSNQIASREVNLFVAQRVRFTLTNSTGGLNGLFEFDPNQATVDVDYSKSVYDEAGADLDAGAAITNLVVLDNITYVAGNFSATSRDFQNVFAIRDGNSTALPQGGLDAQVSALFVFENVLYLGGNFTNTTIKEVPGLKNVAAFNITSNTWQALGSGVRGRVNSIVPLAFNITQGQPETCITINGDFDQVEASGSHQARAVQGFAVWVPSRQTWLQDLNLQIQAVSGKLSAAVNYGGTTQLLAGAISAQDVGASGAVYLASGPLRLNSAGIKVQPRQLSDSPNQKRAINGQNVTGVVTGLFHSSGGHNLTILGGHFTANASNGSRIDNLAIVNGTGTVTGVVNGLDTDSVFLALETQNDILYAGGTITGSINNANVNGLIIYDLAQNNYAFPQPPAFGGSDVAVNSITVKPGTAQAYVGGNFQTAGSLGCPSVCMFENGQWSQPGSGLGGSVAALIWQGSDKLLAGGNLTVNNNPTSLAKYDTKKQQWTAVDRAGSDVPGPVTALSRANKEASQFWVAGKSANNSAFLMKYDGSTFKPVGALLGDQTTIRGLSVLQLSGNHESSDLVEQGMTLLVTGQLNLPTFGNASAALFNGTTFTPFIISTSGNNPGSLSQLFSENKPTFKSSAGHKALGLVVLVALACALGCIFIVVVAGIAIEHYRRKKEGYAPAPTSYLEKTGNMERIPPEYLFGRLGRHGPVDAPHI